MTDDSDSDARSSVGEEENRESPFEEGSSANEDSANEDSFDEMGDDEELDDIDDDEADDDDDDDDDNDGDSPKEEQSKKKKALEDEKPTQDITTVALERTIFVGNLPREYNQRQVAKLFKPCGPVENARIRSVVPDKEKLPPKVALITKRIHPKVDSVNAYVVFAKTDDNECINRALAMNGQVIDGHHIRVDRASQPNSKRMTLTSRKKSVFVGNLRFDLRDDDLIGHFSKAGSVDYVRLIRDRATGLGKGFGFVKFLERASVKKALEMNDTDFKGRKLRVKKVDEKMKVSDDDAKPSKKFQKKPDTFIGDNVKPRAAGPLDSKKKKKPGDKFRQTARSIQFKTKRPEQSNQPKQLNQRTFTGAKHGQRPPRPPGDGQRKGPMGYKKQVKFDLNNKRKPTGNKFMTPKFESTKIGKKKTTLKKKGRAGKAAK